MVSNNVVATPSFSFQYIVLSFKLQDQSPKSFKGESKGKKLI